MMNLLAQTANGNLAETIGIVMGSALVVLGGREGVAALHRRRANGSSYNKALCTERHQRIDKDMDTLFQKLDKHGEKLDQIHEAVLKK